MIAQPVEGEAGKAEERALPLPILLFPCRLVGIGNKTEWRVRVKAAGALKGGHLVEERRVCGELEPHRLARAGRISGWTPMSELARPMAEGGLKRKNQMERCHRYSLLEPFPPPVARFRQKPTHNSSRRELCAQQPIQARQ